MKHQELKIVTDTFEELHGVANVVMCARADLSKIFLTENPTDPHFDQATNSVIKAHLELRQALAHLTQFIDGRLHG